jgi:hypothetical protein
MKRRSFQVSTKTYTKIMDCLDGSSPQKIAAIKALRAATSSGLREAKEAIERLQHEKFGAHYPHASKSALSIFVGPTIKKLVVDFGDGNIEVDLEEMQMKALMQLQVIGLDAARDILDLVEALEAYSAGKKIGVL